MVIKRDKKSKEESIKYEEKYKKEKIGVRGNTCLKCRNRVHERRGSEVIKKVDSTRSLD